MNVETFRNLKNSKELLELNKEMISLINLLSNGKKLNKNSTKMGNQILKNPKMQLLKDKIENKVNSILNKLSELNMNNLLSEFIESLGKINAKDYLEVQKAFYVKMQMDINFVKIYMEFFKIVSNVYLSVFNFNPEFFYSIIEMKFMSDYNDISLENDNFAFLNDFNDENKRINNLNIIKTMLNCNMFLQEGRKEIENNLLEQNNYYVDIYYWFQNENLTNEQKEKIKNKTLNNTLPLREKVLLDNLVSDVKEVKQVESVKPIKNNYKAKVVQKKEEEKIDIDTLKLETENILEEYINFDNLDDMKEFIDDRCKDALSKNKFCQYLFNRYFESNTEIANKILDLVRTLVKKQILYKSNLSRGVLLIHNNWDDVSIDFSNPNKKMKDLLLCLKNMGITKYLETLLKENKIDFV
jgi:hypothetical protein